MAGGDDPRRGVDLGIDGITDAVEVGRGGFGTVYDAAQPALGRRVAVKVLDVAPPDGEAVRRFQRERLALGSLSGHPNIVTLHDAGTSRSGRPYLIMALAPGGSLQDRVAAGPVPWDEVVAIGVKVARALDAAHRVGVLHRDVSPANVLRSADGEPRLADFGIARLADPGAVSRSVSIAGTPVHLAPEVVAGEDATVASDVYALCSTLYTLLAGRPAFAATPDGGLMALLHRVGHEPVPPLPAGTCPPALEALLAAGMAKSPAARPATAAAVAEALAGVAASPSAPLAAALPASSGPVSARRARPSPSAPPRRPRAVVLAVATAVAAVVAVAAGALAFAAWRGGGGGSGAGSGARHLDEPVRVLWLDGALLVADQGLDQVLRVGADGAVTVVAGSGEEGFGGDGGPAVDALLHDPQGLAVGPSGEVYIADHGNNRVRRVGADGAITTVAGTGEAAFAGDGGPALRAALSEPYAVAALADGAVLVADYANHRVRRVGADGVITTLAGTGTPGSAGDGGPAAAAQLAGPSDLAVTADGSVLVADFDARRVRRIDAGGVISTFAGDGRSEAAGDSGPAVQASLVPTELALDGADVLIADHDNHRIRRVRDGVISTVVGTGVAGSSGDGGAAVAAQVARPRGIAADPGGGFWFVDFDNRRVRRVDGAGSVDTFLR